MNPTDKAPDQVEKPDQAPMAIVESAAMVSGRFVTRFWWLTLACVLLSLGLFWYARQRDGQRIQIQFDDGFGLKPDDRLRYRGIDVGAVERVELSDQTQKVLVHVRLTPEATFVAAEGAKFWIVRPVFSLDAIQGLDTLIGAKYLAVEPAPPNTRSQSKFVGLEKPPIVIPSSGALEIILDAKTRGGLENGAPILYRGFTIGKVVQVGLASDARSVRARCAIDPEFRELIRKGSKFWNRSGWRLDIGITGIKLDADTLSQIVSGGIEMATPADGSAIVSTGRFVLHDAPEPEWLQWQPSLPFGKAWSQLESNMPQPIRIALRWQERRYGFRNNEQSSAWCLPLSDGTVLCFSDQVIAPKSALAGSASIELAGFSSVLDQVKIVSVAKQPAIAGEPSVVRFTSDVELPADLPRWPSDRIASEMPIEVCDIFVAQSDVASVVSIDSARLSVSDQGWKIDETIAFTADQTGSPVVSAATGQIIGLLEIKGSISRVLPINY
ncbi:MAG: MlaD family protein [Pirellula sp.]